MWNVGAFERKRALNDHMRIIVFEHKWKPFMYFRKYQSNQIVWEMNTKSVYLRLVAEAHILLQELNIDKLCTLTERKTVVFVSTSKVRSDKCWTLALSYCNSFTINNDSDIWKIVRDANHYPLDHPNAQFMIQVEYLCKVYIALVLRAGSARPHGIYCVIDGTGWVLHYL